MHVNYPTKYQDKFGEETTTIHNDGKTLRMNLRDVVFVGSFLMAYFALADKMAGFVQETHLCPEFEKRIPGTGYRG